MSFSVQISHMHMSHGKFSRSIVVLKVTIPSAGASKHHLELEGPDATVGDLKALIERITEVPSDAQKIIFKGKLYKHMQTVVGVGCGVLVEFSCRFRGRSVARWICELGKSTFVPCKCIEREGIR